MPEPEPNHQGFHLLPLFNAIFAVVNIIIDRRPTTVIHAEEVIFPAIAKEVLPDVYGIETTTIAHHQEEEQEPQQEMVVRRAHLDGSEHGLSAIVFYGLYLGGTGSQRVVPPSKGGGRRGERRRRRRLRGFAIPPVPAGSRPRQPLNRTESNRACLQ